MPEELLIVNPRRRRRVRGAGGRFVKSSRRRRRNPVALANPRRRRRRHNPIAALANPRRRRRRHRNPVALANPRRRRRHHSVRISRRRRHNPRIAFSPRGILNAVFPATIGALGAIGVDVAMKYIPLPAQFQTPLWKNVARVGAAFGLSYAASYVLGREKAKQVLAGALTVASYNALRDLIATNFPQLGLSGIDAHDMSDLRLGYINPAPMLTNGPGVGAYMRNPAGPGMGAYMRDSLDTVNSLHGVTNDGM